MTDIVGPVYEVTHVVDPDIIESFDAWLRDHVSAMLTLPGILRAETFIADADDVGRPRRVANYYFESDRHLNEYLEGPAERLRQSALDSFAGQFEVSRRILRQSRVTAGQPGPTERCLNCNANLAGQYCGQCGQRASSRLISIWQLLQEAFGDLLEFDSRLWATLIPLLIRPGKLTLEYLQGRRVRFMPPFRTYLVLSIVFFVVAFFDPRESFGIFFESDTATVPAESAVAVNVEDGEDEFSCADIEIEAEDFPPSLERRLTPERLQLFCERITADNGQAFGGKLIDNTPAALIVLLPLMALILKLLYPLSRRYYVEHLLFVVHFHAFIFLLLTLQVLFGRLSGVVGFPSLLSGAMVAASFAYSFVYLYKAMRRVYGQGPLMTSVKFMMLCVAYTVGIATMMVFTALFAALSF